MSDFKQNLRRYIDGLEQPISVHETMNRQQARRRFRAPAAVLAGAAVVMIPAMVLIGIRFLPGDDGDVAQTTAPAISETSTTVTESTTTTTTGAPSSLVTVPNIVGLSLERAEEVLASLGLELEVIEMRPSSEFTGISAQEPVGSTSVAVGSTVIVDVYVQPTCVADDADLPDGSMGVTVLFQCGTSRYPDISFPTTRAVPEDADVITATLQALLAGPSEAERGNGYGSFFSTESAGALDSATLDSGRLTVDFNDDILIGNASTSTGSLFFMAELQANLFQFEEVESIEFQIDGNCDAFWNWLQGNCEIVTRNQWDERVAVWDTDRELDPEPGQEIRLDSIVGQIFTTQTAESGQDVLHLINGETKRSGFSEIGGWLLDDPADDPATWTNWALHVSGLNEEMVWLVDSIERTDDGRMVFAVRATLRIPWDEIEFTADPFVVTGADVCTVDGSADPKVFAVAEISMDSDGSIAEAMRTLRAWRIDVADASFLQIETDGIECLFEYA